jgi:hypothetical protein
LTLEEVEILASEIPISDDDDIVDFKETICDDLRRTRILIRRKGFKGVFNY